MPPVAPGLGAGQMERYIKRLRRQSTRAAAFQSCEPDALMTECAHGWRIAVDTHRLP